MKRQEKTTQSQFGIELGQRGEWLINESGSRDALSKHVNIENKGVAKCDTLQ